MSNDNALPTLPVTKNDVELKIRMGISKDNTLFVVEFGQRIDSIRFTKDEGTKFAEAFLNGLAHLK